MGFFFLLFCTPYILKLVQQIPSFTKVLYIVHVGKKEFECVPNSLFESAPAYGEMSVLVMLVHPGEGDATLGKEIWVGGGMSGISEAVLIYCPLVLIG